MNSFDAGVGVVLKEVIDGGSNWTRSAFIRPIQTAVTCRRIAAQIKSISGSGERERIVASAGNAVIALIKSLTAWKERISDMIIKLSLYHTAPVSASADRSSIVRRTASVIVSRNRTIRGSFLA